MQLPVAALLMVLAVGEQRVEAVSLNGQTRVGLLQHLSADDARLLADDQEVVLETGGLQTLRFLDADEAEEFDKENRTEVELVNGSRIYCTQFVADSRTVTLTSPVAGEVTLPLMQVHRVRLAAWESAIDDDWQDLREREAEQDLLIVRRGDDLDFTPVVVGAIGSETITVLLGERELELPRERVFGFVFPREEADEKPAVCSLQSEAGDQFRLQSLKLQDGALTGSIAAGSEVAIPADQVQLIDFSLGRIRYLTDMEAAASYEPVGPITEEYVLKYKRVEYANDRQYPHLVIGRKIFRRGLWIHSGTVLQYRLNREFTSLKTVMGMNRSSPYCSHASVRVQLSADGKVVLDEVVTWADGGQELDIDVEGVRDLEIRVDSVEEGPLRGICEHLALADARVIR